MGGVVTWLARESTMASQGPESMRVTVPDLSGAWESLRKEQLLEMLNHARKYFGIPQSPRRTVTRRIHTKVVFISKHALEVTVEEALLNSL
ncbi:hypothetical protein PpBr36_07059 [Pyricularia pennisetigena]|uniref:hypothetical protein n=1 Tax=Pyricularia pennisetigena TaxID=1578925 RepID=UPI001152AA6B|nr:hypothetical protein PpBr36_07059 [Pyricularia pennisetigena]TLS25184.1 hypothetical protein PpBr36_07059 [Pyricularia pennisetigena]